MMLKTAAFIALLLGVTTAAQADCKLAEMAKLPLEIRGNQAFIPGKLRGEPIRVLVDTGAGRTMFDLSVVKKAGLSIEDAPYRAMGLGGEMRLQQATFDDLEIGGMKVPTKRLLVNASGFRGAFAGLLGFDFFGKVDIELNFKAGEMKLFQPADCEGSVLAYWAPDKADSVDMLASKDGIEIPVSINGATFRASLDTGAYTSVAGRKVADYFGLETSGAGKSYGADNRALENAFHKFETFEIGAETIRNPTMRLSSGMATGFANTGSRMEDRSGAVDVLLGFDFMRSHRIFVSNSQRRVYFTYEGGPVFPVPQAAAK
jgi:predicted aspartyl protease